MNKNIVYIKEDTPVEVVENLLAAAVADTENYRYYGLPTVKTEAAEYAVAKDNAEADKAALAFIGDNLGSLGLSFLSEITGVSYDELEGIAESHEIHAADEKFAEIVEKTCGMDKIHEVALDNFNRGDLSYYDCHEIELPNGMLAYRIA